MTEDGCTVYPRVGGGTPLIQLRALGGIGLSPRGRGNRLDPVGQ